MEFKAENRPAPNAPGPVLDVQGSVRVKRIVLAEWTYDVCLLLGVTDNTAYPKAALYQSANDLTPWAGDNDNSVAFKLRDGTLPANYTLLQAGYGQTSAGNAESKAFAFKVSELAANAEGAPATYYDAMMGTNTDVIKLKSSAAWTTLPGDSGGPLFAFNKVNKKLVVIGVTLGSDVFATREDEATALQRNANDGAHNNACTSLKRIYEAWDTSSAKFTTSLVAPSFAF
jgi:hypothetical protein